MTPERWQRIEALYHAACALPADERAAFLLKECPDDAGLRREVELLLEDSGRTESVLSIGAPTLASWSTAGELDDMTGRVFGGYRLRTLLGVGGMGEVYLAHDTQLRRDVAIKLLPREFTSDPIRRARFKREARMLAALNHPNICAIYGLEESADIWFLVLELVAGDTLATRLGDRGRALSVHEALLIARQIAEALEVTHERGVIHRDLKPANVKITPEQVVKVLDFGLAKSVAGDGAPADSTQSTPGRELESQAGVVMGTAAYMSPEQARGLGVDKRTDIWAFGVVLFEMVAGERPFKGQTPTDTLASVLTAEPDWSQLPSTATPKLRRLLEQCLQKDPGRRLQSIGDARVQIEDLLAGVGEEPVTGDDARVARGRLVVTAWIIAALAVAIATFVAAQMLRTPAFFSVLPPPGVTLVTEESPVLSPDGLLLAYVACDGGGTQRLYVYTLGTTAPAKPLANTEGASLPFWSPRSNAIGFFAQGFLKTVDIATEGSRTLASAGGPRGGTWSRDDVIVYVPMPLGGPYRVSATSNGGEGTRVPPGPGGSRGGWFPSFLPDGRHFLEFAPTVKQLGNSAVWVVSLESGERERLVDSQSNAIYAQNHVMFWRAGNLWAVAFDTDTRKPAGDPTRVADAVGLNPVTNQALFSVSSSGGLAYFSGAVGHTELEWVDRKSNEISRPGATGVIGTIALSPDDSRVAYDLADPETRTFDIWQLVFGSGAPAQLTVDPSNDVFPLWADSNRLSFTSVRERPPQIYETRPNVVGGEARLFESKLPVVATGWSRGGGTLFYTAADPDTATGDIWSVALDTLDTPTPIVKTKNDERYGTPSPDGRWLAYVSNESGKYEVRVLGLLGASFSGQISTGGGSQPQWSDSGTELFYLGLNRALFVVDFTSGAEAFRAGPPRQLFRTRTKSLEAQGTQRTYAVASDGQRFLVANATEEAKAASIRVVKNWLSAVGK